MSAPVRRLLASVPALATLAAAAMLAACAGSRGGMPHVEEQPSHPGEPGLQVPSFEMAWSRIEETYPHPDMKGLDWPAVREELLPRARAARTADELRPVLFDMLSRLGESHFNVFPGQVYERFERLSELAEEISEESETKAPARGAGDSRASSGADEPSASSATPGGEERAPAEHAPGGQGDLGLDIRIVDGEALVTTVAEGGPADVGGVRQGWSLLRIGRLSTAEVIEASSLAEDRQAAYRAYLTLASALRGRPGSSVTLAFRHGGGGEASIDLERREAPGKLVRFANLPPFVTEYDARLQGDVGYIRFNIFLPNVAVPFSSSMREFVTAGVEGVVVDLRGNPGGLGGMVMGMAGHFIAERDQSLGTMITRENELRFVANPRSRSQRFDGPLAILIDELSASTSEIFAAGLQGLGRARVFGTNSAGAALPSWIEALPNGDRLQFATADLTAPDGTRIEGIGVRPDQPVPLSRPLLLAGGDPAMEAALDWIRGQADS